jgi:hypothetical protein
MLIFLKTRVQENIASDTKYTSWEDKNIIIKEYSWLWHLAACTYCLTSTFEIYDAAKSRSPILCLHPVK